MRPRGASADAWAEVARHAARLRSIPTRSLFAADAARVERMSLDVAGLHLDFSKQRIDNDAMEALRVLARSADVAAQIRQQFAGDAVNFTEGRAALHMALRAPKDAANPPGGPAIASDVHGVLDRIEAFDDRVRTGAWVGFTGEPITDVVNIGIGGSDLGPRMVCEALAESVRGPRPHFVSNVDATELTRVLRGLKPQTTLFIVTSKSFGTAETLANATTARAWLVDALGDQAAVAKHFVAVSTAAERVSAFGIDPQNMFGFWSWVGGRYSLWSAVGLSIALALGMDSFRALLAGAHAMDEHVRAAPLESNAAAWMALVGIWNSNALGLPSQVIVPYAQALARVPAYLQQLEMESNGKSVRSDGHATEHQTVPALWGDVGTNGQHAFFQMLHQGPQPLPIDFILPVRLTHGQDHQHRMLVANCLAQSEALMQGKSAEQVREELAGQGMSGETLEDAVPHRVFEGSRPSTTILLPTIDPAALGALLALYEHKVFIQSVVWGINAFDQWGVELGKQLATVIEQELASGQAGSHDASTTALMHRVQAGWRVD
ncbi:glucose-6-phosphate isomerase [uncultured Abyssibacter sp.]|uniref:glucose-6-phosphate isomerase n=1 Tax=uncultured Abyssibacter sp. TaxID=2320202 RepID=UPI0032B12D9D